MDLSGKLSMAQALAFTPDGTVLATVGGSHEIYLWETKTYSNFATLKCPGPTACIAISPDGKKIAAGEDARKGRIWILDMPPPMEK